MKTAIHAPHHPKATCYEACFFWPLKLNTQEMEIEACRRAESEGLVVRRVVAIKTHHLSYYGDLPSTVTVVTLEVVPVSPRGNGHA